MSRKNRLNLPSKMNIHFFKSVNFSPSYGNSRFKKYGSFRKTKKNWVFIFFPKNQSFGRKSLMEIQSFFDRAISLYFLFFFIFGLWNFTCDVIAWTILLRVFERTTGSCIWAFNCLEIIISRHFSIKHILSSFLFITYVALISQLDANITHVIYTNCPCSIFLGVIVSPVFLF